MHNKHNGMRQLKYSLVILPDTRNYVPDRIKHL